MEEGKQEKGMRQALKKLRRFTIYRFATGKELDETPKTSPFMYFPLTVSNTSRTMIKTFGHLSRPCGKIQ
jgi:hypothetical protein